MLTNDPITQARLDLTTALRAAVRHGLNEGVCNHFSMAVPGRPADTTLDKYYEENVVGGPGSFMIVAANFDDFGRAVRSKLIREISSRETPAAPLPG